MAKGVPSDPSFLFQVKWDGVRMIAHIGNGNMMLHNRKLNHRTAHYPELVRLAELIQHDVILDGEIVALREGKPSFPLVLERDLIGGSTSMPDAAKVRRAMQRVPIYYMVFDILYFKGKDITGLPLRERYEILGNLLPEDDTIHLVENFTDGEELFAALSAKKMEGIVAKDERSAYLPGKKHATWQKIKFRQRQLVVIGGYTIKNGQLNALLAGAYHKGDLVYLGRVATGLSGRDIAGLSPFLKASVRVTSPFINASSGKEKIWVEPKLVALIDFQEWTQDLRMRQPVIKGFTQDHPEDCVLT